ncbi:MAG: malonic semialdehyde reductase [Lentilitoribacter sp.]
MNMNVPNSAPTGEELTKLREAAQQDARDLKAKIDRLDDASIELILSGARSHYAWTDKPIEDDIIYKLYDIVKMGSTSMNGCPARFIFVKTPEGKARVAKSLKPANVPKMMGAPLTVIVAYDTEFWKELPKLFPHEDRRHLFKDKPEYSEETAFRNSTLQGGYLMIAARALGLDIGAMSGFSNKIIDEEFFNGTSVKSNFLCNIGYADETALFQRLPRFAFDDVCEVV